jgi:hypothetical protein
MTVVPWCPVLNLISTSSALGTVPNAILGSCVADSLPQDTAASGATSRTHTGFSRLSDCPAVEGGCDAWSKQTTQFPDPSMWCAIRLAHLAATLLSCMCPTRLFSDVLRQVPIVRVPPLVSSLRPSRTETASFRVLCGTGRLALTSCEIVKLASLSSSGFSVQRAGEYYPWIHILPEMGPGLLG